MLRTALIAVLLAPITSLADPIAVTVGDSIVQTYPEPYDVPIQGWGAKLSSCAPGVTWVNKAVGGNSTKTFRDRGHWEAALAENPDYILIQFGYGDATPWEGYTTPSEFRENLHQMVLESRAIAAVPILVTPASVRTEAPDGIHVERPSGLEPWAQAMIDQGAADGVQVIDMHSWTLDVYDELGIDEAQQLFGFEISPGNEDRLHFSIYGADQAAQFVAANLPAMAGEPAGVPIFPY